MSGISNKLLAHGIGTTFNINGAITAYGRAVNAISNGDILCLESHARNSISGATATFPIGNDYVGMPMGNNLFLLGYTTSSNDVAIRVGTVATSSSAPTFGIDYMLGVTTATYLELCNIDNNNFIVSYVNATTQNLYMAKVTLNSDKSITYNTPVMVKTLTGTSVDVSYRVISLTNTRFFVCYMPYISANTGRGLVVDMLGTNFTAYSEVTTLAGSSNNAGKGVCKISSNEVITSFGLTGGGGLLVRSYIINADGTMTLNQSCPGSSGMGFLGDQNVFLATANKLYVISYGGGSTVNLLIYKLAYNANGSLSSITYGTSTNANGSLNSKGCYGVISNPQAPRMVYWDYSNYLASAPFTVKGYQPTFGTESVIVSATSYQFLSILMVVNNVDVQVIAYGLNAGTCNVVTESYNINYNPLLKSTAQTVDAIALASNAVGSVNRISVLN